MAAPVVQRLGASAVGVGGPALRRLDFQSLARIETLAEMGPDATLRARSLLVTFMKLRGFVRRARPRAALLVGFSEFNARLGPWLRRRGVKVLWYSPPQVWAWRGGRAARLVHAADHMALTLPFEEALWRRHGANASYVGHPALERIPALSDEQLTSLDGAPSGNEQPTSRGGARPEDERLDSPRGAATPAARPRIALLPGSRAGELKRHVPVLLAAERLLAAQGFECALSAAEGLPPGAASWLQREAQRAGVPIRPGDIASALNGAALSLVCSGTASLEAALSGVPPVIFYRLEGLTGWVLRRVVSTAHIGLPNVVLGRRAFPELVGAEVTAARLTEAALGLLQASAAARADCAEVRRHLTEPLTDPDVAPSARVAALLSGWLA